MKLLNNLYWNSRYFTERVPHWLCLRFSWLVTAPAKIMPFVVNLISTNSLNCNPILHIFILSLFFFLKKKKKCNIFFMQFNPTFLLVFVFCIITQLDNFLLILSILMFINLKKHSLIFLQPSRYLQWRNPHEKQWKIRKLKHPL